MPIRLVELPPERVGVDESRFPDRDDSLVYLHLLFYYSLLEVLPAISIRVDETGAVVTRGHKTLRAARELERPAVRAIVQPASGAHVEEFLARSGAKELDWAAIDAWEREHPVVDQWQVFFFARPLDAAERARFTDVVAGFFATSPPSRLLGEVEFDDDRAHFQVRVNVEDRRWYDPYLAAIYRFHSESVPVVSFQGRRFTVPSE